MSIILDALKKTPKKQVDVKADTTKSAQELNSKSSRPQASRSDASNLNMPALIAVAIILGLIFLISLKPKTKAPDLAASPSQKLTAEGYSSPPETPRQESRAVSIFKPKTINPRLTLNGIVYGMGKPTAIIENRILEEGQSIRGSKVVKIYQDKVELLNEFSGEIFVLKLR